MEVDASSKDVNMNDKSMPKKQTARVARIIIGLFLAFALAVAIFVGGFVTGTSLKAAGAIGGNVDVSNLPLVESGQEADPPEDVEFDVFWEVWNTLEDQHYDGVPSEEERVRGAIEGMINTLDDPYTAYISPDTARIMQEDSSGSFEGIGAYVEEAPEGGVYIIRVFENGPAAKAGLRAGDVVIEVDGEDVTDNTLRENLLLIRGEAGTDVTLTVAREGEEETLEITITRAKLEVPTVRTDMLEDDIGYVALFDFNARASNRLRRAVDDLMDAGAKAIILDLRNNPGGFLDESINVADMFLADGLILIQRDVDGNERTYTANDGDFAEDIPLVVLVNENSASASEIVAAAISDNERGTLIGQTTFGKGSVQLQYSLSDNGLLRVTYARWYTPDDVSISENGVEPDIVVDPESEDEPDGLSPGEDIDPSADPVLQRAIEYLQEER